MEVGRRRTDAASPVPDGRVSLGKGSTEPTGPTGTGLVNYGCEGGGTDVLSPWVSLVNINETTERSTGHA